MLHALVSLFLHNNSHFSIDAFTQLIEVSQDKFPSRLVTQLSVHAYDGDDLVIVGDMHGSGPDIEGVLARTLLNDTFLHETTSKVVFLGDYVDRGTQSHAVLSLVLLVRLLFPDRVILLRGNHESRSLNIRYGYYADVLKIYTGNKSAFQIVEKGYETLNPCVIITVAQETGEAYRVLFVHGGAPVRHLPENLLGNSTGPDEERELLTDILWSDPSPSAKRNAQGFQKSSRGAGVEYSFGAYNEWATRASISATFRGHQVPTENVSGSLYVKQSSFSLDFSEDTREHLSVKCSHACPHADNAVVYPPCTECVQRALVAYHFTVFSSTNYKDLRNAGTMAYLRLSCKTFAPACVTFYESAAGSLGFSELLKNCYGDARSFTYVHPLHD